MPSILYVVCDIGHQGNMKPNLTVYIVVPLTFVCCVQAEGVLTLKLGALKALRHERSGQVLSMDWLPEKPHNIMAIGFYDGMN